MTVETENQDTHAAGSDEVSHEEYAAWEKGEEAAEGDDDSAEVVQTEEPAEEPAGETEEEAEPVAEEEPAPQAEEEDDSQLSRGLKKRLDKIREREREALAREAAANARAAAAEALLAAQRGEDTEEEPTPAAKPKERVYTQDELKAEAAKMAAQQVAQEAFNQRCNDAVDKGNKEFGEKAFRASLEALGDVGLIDPADVSFLQEVMETEAPAKLLHHLGQNPEEAERLSGLSPTRRAVALDRLAVQLAAEKPKPKPISKAPAPIQPLSGSKTRKEIDINDPNLSDEEAFAAFERLDRQRVAG